MADAVPVTVAALALPRVLFVLSFDGKSSRRVLKPEAHQRVEPKSDADEEEDYRRQSRPGLKKLPPGCRQLGLLLLSESATHLEDQLHALKTAAVDHEHHARVCAAPDQEIRVPVPMLTQILGWLSGESQSQVEIVSRLFYYPQSELDFASVSEYAARRTVAEVRCKTQGLRVKLLSEHLLLQAAASLGIFPNWKVALSAEVQLVSLELIYFATRGWEWRRSDGWWSHTDPNKPAAAAAAASAGGAGAGRASRSSDIGQGPDDTTAGPGQLGQPRFMEEGAKSGQGEEAEEKDSGPGGEEERRRLKKLTELLTKPRRTLLDKPLFGVTTAVFLPRHADSEGGSMKAGAEGGDDEDLVPALPAPSPPASFGERSS